MDLLLHVAVTTSAAILLAAVFGNGHRIELKSQVGDAPAVSSEANHSTGQGFSSALWSWLDTLGKYVDLRILVIGSLLPDIIDKPIGYFIFKSTFNNGRIFAHTLLFLIVLTLTGWIIYKRFRKTWMLVLAFGTFIHLILDEVWTSPRSFFWPLFGFTFPRSSTTDWVGDMLHDLVTNPATYISETICLIILVWFMWFLNRKGQLRSIILTGRIISPSRQPENRRK